MVVSTEQSVRLKQLELLSDVWRKRVHVDVSAAETESIFCFAQVSTPVSSFCDQFSQFFSLIMETFTHTAQRAVKRDPQ